MKTKLILLFLCLPFLGIGQFSSSLDVIIGSEYSYRHLLTTSSEDSGVQFTIDRKDLESPKYNWRFGVNYNKKLSQKFYLKTGLRLARGGYVLNQFYALQYGTQHDGQGGFDPNAPTLEEFNDLNISYNYLFVEIPIVGRYQLSEKKWSPFIEFGVSPMISLEKSNLRTYNKFHLASNLSVGVNYTPFEKVQFFAQPIFRYHFTNLVDDTPIKEHLYNYGLEFGARWKI